METVTIETNNEVIGEDRMLLLCKLRCSMEENMTDAEELIALLGCYSFPPPNDVNSFIIKMVKERLHFIKFLSEKYDRGE